MFWWFIPKGTIAKYCKPWIHLVWTTCGRQTASVRNVSENGWSIRGVLTKVEKTSRENAEGPKPREGWIFEKSRKSKKKDVFENSDSVRDVLEKIQKTSRRSAGPKVPRGLHFWEKRYDSRRRGWKMKKRRDKSDGGVARTSWELSGYWSKTIGRFWKCAFRWVNGGAGGRALVTSWSKTIGEKMKCSYLPRRIRGGVGRGR